MNGDPELQIIFPTSWAPPDADNSLGNEFYTKKYTEAVLLVFIRLEKLVESNKFKVNFLLLKIKL